MNDYLNVLKNYAGFRGRASRTEYWYFVLFNTIFALVAMALDNLLGTTFHLDIPGTMVSLPYGYIFLVYGLITLIPNLAVSVRRLHDVNKSGWFLLIGLIPLIGGIWLLVLYCTAGSHGPNQYGTDPNAEPEMV